MRHSAKTGMTREADLDFERSQLRVRADLARVVIVRAQRTPGQVVHDKLDALPHDVPTVHVGRTMIDALLDHSPDVVVVDHDPAEFDILRLCRDVHDSLNARLIVVGADHTRYDEPEIIDILDAGADDFLPRSTSAEMMLARIRVAIRSAPSVHRQHRQLIVGDVVVDLDAHALFIAGEFVKCPPRQFLLLVALASQPNRVVTRDSLLASVWNAAPGSVDTRRLRIAVSLLRGVLGRGPHRPHIETVSHVGYRLVAENEESAAPD